MKLKKRLSFKKFDKFPTLLGIFLLLILAVFLVAVKKKGVLFSHASAGETPENVKISNITDHSFVVSWKTSALAKAVVSVDIANNNFMFRDVRDQPSGVLKKFSTHYVVIDKHIQPEKEYRFTIISNNNSFRNSAYKVRTAHMINGSFPEANLAFGRVKTQNDENFNGGIVYLDIPGFSLLSSLTSSQGNWVVPLNVSFDSRLSRLADSPLESTEEQISVEGGVGGSAMAVNFVGNNKPVPDIILGNNHDFRNLVPQAEAEKKVVSAGGFAKSVSESSSQVEFKINNPSQGEKINTTRPEIFGVGPAGGQIEIVVESSQVFKSNIKIGGDQKWHWTVPGNLSPGEHTLTANYTSPKGERKKIIKKFIVLASDGGGQPAFSASGSATISPSVLPTPTLLPTPIPTILPTPTAVVRGTMPSTASGVPSSGFSSPQFFILALSLSFLLISYSLFFVF